MAFQNKENTGRIFMNKDKRSEKSPDFTGQINIDGTEYRIALWENFKEAFGGSEEFSHFSASVSIPEGNGEPQTRKPASTERRTYTKPSRG